MARALCACAAASTCQQSRCRSLQVGAERGVGLFWCIPCSCGRCTAVLGESPGQVCRPASCCGQAAWLTCVAPVVRLSHDSCFLAMPHCTPHTPSRAAGIVTADTHQQQPLGVMHLLAGVQAAAAQHWNESHPDTSLGLVALELEFSPRGAALLAAPGPGGSPRRLKVRPVKPGVVELLARDAPAAHAGAQEGAVALQSGGGAEAAGAWPLSSVSPAQLQVRWMVGCHSCTAALRMCSGQPLRSRLASLLCCERSRAREAAVGPV